MTIGQRLSYNKQHVKLGLIFINTFELVIRSPCQRRVKGSISRVVNEIFSQIGLTSEHNCFVYLIY